VVEVLTTVGAMRAALSEWRRAAKTVGFVPTMGYLHDGHLALVRRAGQENDIVVASIFVNPLQFGPKEDLARYPRDFERDSKLLEAAGVTAIFYPDASEMYPPDFSTSVEVSRVSEGLEGGVRPGHFRGVATVVSKLFNIVTADKAYFGQKDAQQIAVIKRMVRDLNFGIEIVVCPTVREKDGLAMSSRNVYLSAEERRAAPVLRIALEAAARLWHEAPEQRNGENLRKIMQAVLDSESLANPDYVSAADPASLQEYAAEIPSGNGVLLSLAVRFGATRLIDNMLIEG
jgi:pantoate--beta-alanine ligase